MIILLGSDTRLYDHLEEEKSLPFVSQNFKRITLPNCVNNKMFE